MANYYYVTIKSNKMTQDVAQEIFQLMNEKCKIRYFNFCEGQLKYNTRGLVDIINILQKYGLTDEDIIIKDEFEMLAEEEMIV